MRYALATLRWTDPADGGRRRSVEARRYMAPAAFGDSAPEWTLVVDRSDASPGGQEKALVHFLMEHAPHGELTVGRTFCLFEGPRMVATGEISEVFELNPAAWSDGMAA